MARESSGLIWMNGKLVPWDDAKIHVGSHALHYGSAVFEGLRCYATPEGSAVFRRVQARARNRRLPGLTVAEK